MVWVSRLSRHFKLVRQLQYRKLASLQPRQQYLRKREVTCGLNAQLILLSHVEGQNQLLLDEVKVKPGPAVLKKREVSSLHAVIKL